MIVADTDVLIDYLRGFEPVAGRIALELAHSALSTTAVTSFELHSGAHSPRQRRAVETLLAAMTVVPLGPSEASRAALVHRVLSEKGQQIGMADSLIAGICLERDAILLTRNRRHFERVEGLYLGRLGVGEGKG